MLLVIFLFITIFSYGIGTLQNRFVIKETERLYQLMQRDPNFQAKCMRGCAVKYRWYLIHVAGSNNDNRFASADLFNFRRVIVNQGGTSFKDL